jgi:hypothetical protein
MPKSGWTNMTHMLQHTKGFKKELWSTMNVEYDNWFCHHDIKHFVSGNKMKHVLDWPIVSCTWPMKIGTNLSRDEAWRLRKLDFICNKGRHCLLVTCFQQSWPSPSIGPVFVYHQTRMCTLHLGLRRKCIVIIATPTTDHKNKWECSGLMDGYYMVGVFAIQYPSFGVISNIISKEDIAYHVTNWQHFTYVTRI